MTSSPCGTALIEPSAVVDILEAEAVRSSRPTEVRWSLGSRIVFRFIFSYLVLYAGPIPISMVPGAGYLISKYENFLNWLVPWVGSHILRHPVPGATLNGSGDTTFGYVELFTYLLLATSATIIWSLLDRKRPNYQRLHQWLRLGVRFALGLALLTYGAMKVMLDQMPSPPLSVLLQPYGESSPMRLLWTLIGASGPYQVFCGASEMLAGILLFVPALTTLGALLAIAVMTNVFTLNMCFDVPVKILSFHLLLMAVFLAAPDMQKLAELFLLHRRVSLSQTPRWFRRRWLNWIVVAVQILFGLGMGVTMLYGYRQQAKEFAVRPPYYGVWSVDEYTADGAVRPPLLSDTTRWRKVILDFPERASIQFMDAPQERFILALDQNKKSFTLTKRGNENWKANLSYQDLGQDRLELNGQFDGHQIRAHLHREDESKYLLTSRGFHWINEYPFNR